MRTCVCDVSGNIKVMEFWMMLESVAQMVKDARITLNAIHNMCCRRFN